MNSKNELLERLKEGSAEACNCVPPLGRWETRQVTAERTAFSDICEA